MSNISQEWQKHHGGYCPPIIVEVRFRDGRTKVGKIGDFEYDWSRGIMFLDTDILEYRIISAS